MAISQIPPLTAHILFLLWELNIWQALADQILAHLSPLSNGYFTDFCCDCSSSFPTLRAQHLADAKSWQIYHTLKWQFHRFMPYSKSSYLTDQVLGNLPPFKWQFHRFLLLLLIFISYSGSSTFGRPGLGISTPFSNGNFTDSCSDCSYLFPTLRAQHLADQVLAGWPPINRQFHRFLLYSESSYLADKVLANLPSLSNGNCTDSWSECSYFFPTLRTIFFTDSSSWQVLPPIKRQFHRFLLYSESWTFGRPGLGRI